MRKGPEREDPGVSGIDSVAEFKKRTDRAQTIWFLHMTAAFIGLAIATMDDASRNRQVFGVALFTISFLTGMVRMRKVRRCPVCEAPLRGRYGWGYAIGNRTCQSCDALLTEK